MADWIRRLKAALTPQLILLLLAALALIGYCTLRDQTGDELSGELGRHRFGTEGVLREDSRRTT